MSLIIMCWLRRSSEFPVRQLQMGIDTESRCQIVRMNAPRKALIVWNFGDKMIALDTPRNWSILARIRMLDARKTQVW